MYELKNSGKVFTSKSVGTGPSSYDKRIHRVAVSQRLRNTGLDEGERSISRPCRLNSREGSRYALNCRLFGQQSCLNLLDKRQKSRLFRDSNQVLSSPYPDRCTNYTIPSSLLTYSLHGAESFLRS